jgi:glutamate-1-semialdehyde 2,1-aminomutase
MVRSNESLQEEYRRVTPRSRAQWERAKKSMPGGIIKGAYASNPYPHYVAKADGCHIWDLDGRKYVDFGNHHTTTLVGHNHSEVVQAIKDEADRGFGLGAPTTLEAEIAEEIADRFASIEQVRFTNSGTEASLHATRMVRAISGKPKVAKFEGAYHGTHDALEISVNTPIDESGPAESPTPVASQDGQSRSAEDDVVILPYSDRESAELILREHKDEVAGVFYDAKPGMWDISKDFTRFVRDITREMGILMVMDEVVSLRTGYGGAQTAAGVEPDISIFGKAMGGGLPVGVIGGKAEVMELLDHTQGAGHILQSGSFSGNNFTLAAGLATLRALTPEVYAHLGSLSARLHAGLERAFTDAGVPHQVLSEGAAANFFITDRPATSYRTVAMNHDAAMYERIALGLFLKGYSLRGGIGFTVSAPMENGHIAGVVEALEQVLAEKD